MEKSLRSADFYLRVALLALIVYVSWRAYVLSFTHDESLSYTIVMGDEMRGKTPNHHYLNTWLMALFLRLFGPAEWSLRLGSVLAFGLYAWAGWQLIRTSATAWIKWAGFALLFLNPFVLDFFSLARGYGIAMAGIMASMMALQALTKEPEQTPAAFFKWSFLAAAFGAVGVLGNLALLNWYLPLLGVLGLIWIARYRLLSAIWGRILLSLPLLGGFFYFVLSEAFRLKERGELYFGGQKGLFEDTAKSLAECSLYLQPYGTPGLIKGLAIVLSVLTLLLISAAVLRLLTKRFSDFFIASTSVFALTLLAIAVQHAWLKTPLPSDRMAAYLLPLLGVSAWAGLNNFHRNTYPLGAINRFTVVFALAITVPTAVHFVRTANVEHCYMWHYDKHTKAVMEALPALRQQHFPDKKVSMAAHALFEPAANFYRVTRQYDWLETIPKEGVRDRRVDVYYTLQDDAGNIPAGAKEQQRFEDTKSAVYTRN